MFSYKCRDKRRPVLDVIIASLAIGSAVAFTAGYIYWAVKGTKIYEESVKPVRCIPQIERAVEIHSLGYEMFLDEELSDKL